MADFDIEALRAAVRSRPGVGVAGDTPEGERRAREAMETYDRVRRGGGPQPIELSPDVQRIAEANRRRVEQYAEVFGISELVLARAGRPW
jgi:hypothetical protein